MSASERISAAMEKLDQLKEEIKVDVEEAVGEILKEIFDHDQRLVTIVWTQYTPYFNDGDECIFSIDVPHMGYVKEGVDPETIDEDELAEFADNYYEGTDNIELFEGFYHTEQMLPSTVKKMKDFYSLIQEIDEFIKETLGDHVKVIATRNGVTTEEYDHD